MEVKYTDAEAAANFPEVLQQVRAGKTVVIICDGEAVAEISLPKDQKVPGETRHEYLLRTGQLRTTDAKWNPPPGVRVEGALERFLKERG